MKTLISKNGLFHFIQRGAGRFVIEDATYQIAIGEYYPDQQHFKFLWHLNLNLTGMRDLLESAELFNDLIELI
jgi:hypothetical protein